MAELSLIFEQFRNNDITTADLTRFFAEEEFTETQREEIIKGIDQDFTDIDLILANVSIYSISCEQSTRKFYKWLEARLESLKQGKITEKKFFQMWDKAYSGIEKAMNSSETRTLEAIGIANLLMMIEEMRCEK